MRIGGVSYAFSFAVSGRYPARRVSGDPWVPVRLRQILPESAHKVWDATPTFAGPRSPRCRAVRRVTGPSYHPDALPARGVVLRPDREVLVTESHGASASQRP